MIVVNLSIWITNVFPGYVWLFGEMQVSSKTQQRTPRREKLHLQGKI